MKFRIRRSIAPLTILILQAALVYINTLMIQDILAEPEWASVLTPEDLRGLTPLVWAHVLPYGEVKLNMTRRLALTEEGRQYLERARRIGMDLPVALGIAIFGGSGTVLGAALGALLLLVGTSSLRRVVQLLSARPDLRIVLVRASDVPTYVQHGGAARRTLDMIDSVYRAVERHPRGREEEGHDLQFRRRHRPGRGQVRAGRPRHIP